jgi:hypothetical protein
MKRTMRRLSDENLVLCFLLLADIVTKVENGTTQKNLAKIDLGTSLPLHRFSTPLRRSVIDFG